MGLRIGQGHHEIPGEGPGGGHSTLGVGVFGAGLKNFFSEPLSMV